MKRPRIALLSRSEFDQVKRGLEKYSLDLQRALPEIELFRFDQCPPLPKILKKNLNRFCLEEVKQSGWLDWNFLKRHRREPFDLAITYGEGGWWQGLTNPGIPRLHIYTGCFRAYADETLKGTRGYAATKYFYSPFERLSGRGAYCVSISERVRKEVKQYYRWPSQTIPVGIEFNQWTLMDPKEARKKRALFVGQAEEAKGWDIILKLALAFPEVVFVCILTTKIPPPAPNILIEINLMSEEMNEWYNAADFFIFPSRYESAALVVLEAMACNLPVVISKAVAAVCIDEDAALESRQGVYVVPEDSIKKYIEAVQNCLTRGGRAQTRSYVESHRSFAAFQKNFKKLIGDILKDKGSA